MKEEERTRMRDEMVVLDTVSDHNWKGEMAERLEPELLIGVTLTETEKTDEDKNKTTRERREKEVKKEGRRTKTVLVVCRASQMFFRLSRFDCRKVSSIR
jgi:hypothetical protein